MRQKPRKTPSSPELTSRELQLRWLVRLCWIIPILGIIALGRWIGEPPSLSSPDSNAAQPFPGEDSARETGNSPNSIETRTFRTPASESVYGEGWVSSPGAISATRSAELAQVEVLKSETQADAEEIPGILAELKEQDLSTEFAIEMVRRWTRADPTSAAQWVAGLPAGDNRKTLLGIVAAAWLKADKEAVFSWIMELPNPEEQLSVAMPLGHSRLPPPGPNEASLLPNGFDELAGKDFKAAAKLVGSLPEGNERDTAIEYLAAYPDPRTAMAWVHTLTKSTERKRAFMALVSHLPILCSGPAAGHPSCHAAGPQSVTLTSTAN